MACTCNTAIRGGGTTVVRGDGGISVTGSGSTFDPYVVTAAAANSSLTFSVNDSATVNLQLSGSGTTADPYVLRADTSSASQLRGLGDVSATPVAQQGTVPLWIGTTSGGHFELRTPGTRYTTSTTRGNGLYQGEVARDTDTGKRYEWDGGQWLSLDVTIPSFALDPSVLQNGGSIATGIDWNTLSTTARVYKVTAISSTNNSPAGATGTGSLEVLISGDAVTQSYYTSDNLAWQRVKYGTAAWTSWTQAANQAQVSAVATALTAETAARTAADSTMTAAIATRALTSDLQTINTNIGGRVAVFEQVSKPTFAVSSGDWVLQLASFQRSGNVVTMQLIVQRNGQNIAANAYLGFQVGLISNLNVGLGNVGSGSRATLAGLANYGGVTVGSVLGNAVYLDSTSGSISNGQQFSLGGTWIISNS